MAPGPRQPKVAFNAVNHLEDLEFAGDYGIQRTFSAFMYGELSGARHTSAAVAARRSRSVPESVEKSGIARTSSAVSMI